MERLKCNFHGFSGNYYSPTNRQIFKRTGLRRVDKTSYISNQNPPHQQVLRGVIGAWRPFWHTGRTYGQSEESLPFANKSLLVTSGFHFYPGNNLQCCLTAKTILCLLCTPFRYMYMGATMPNTNKQGRARYFCIGGGARLLKGGAKFGKSEYSIRFF